MPANPFSTKIYHITDLSNLNDIIHAGGLRSDAAMQKAGLSPTVIGYGNIKVRRLTVYQVGCCEHRYVGEFVPFYFCPRSPMLYSINKGNTGKDPGCQKDIVHLVSTVQRGYDLDRQWAISDGNAGSAYTTFSNTETALNEVPWDVVNSIDWSGVRITQKATEFLVADFFPIEAIIEIGCYNQQAATATRAILTANGLHIPVTIHPNWYY